ncbi:MULTISPECIES: hypothetical protein [Enterococcus]|jgi:hypothetical protein|uniref:Uncharacterized protein n=1 Tax=Enterococcus dispar ATCC 51266 TaxID=1139219 RepID=S0KDI7_9ENTE|nr:hypothetical protein [Enterococcus dispar]EOT38995.1 hypothetical protein OMK_02477 [Enterococcus dispar ATCC 51266]EOW86104.1 hypothetical protein I569_01427 [Enterococcus dispar ATCC 51266]MCU7357023.1 hypothetical protein [Enterococcus dispar]MDT2705127.1 hypothetical protein [Enterococcus dispar]OJG39103.1 hypothetical protein RV01_GL001625 [Enterococcus dispar]
MGKVQRYFGLTLLGFLLVYFYDFRDWRLFLLLGLPAALTGYFLAAHHRREFVK